MDENVCIGANAARKIAKLDGIRGTDLNAAVEKKFRRAAYQIERYGTVRSHGRREIIADVISQSQLLGGADHVDLGGWRTDTDAELGPIEHECRNGRQVLGSVLVEDAVSPAAPDRHSNGHGSQLCLHLGIHASFRW